MIEGKVLKYLGENINTDVIWPGKYTYLDISKEEMINYVMENYDAKFKEKIQDKKILVVGKNFGCGSSREQPAIALKAAGIEAIIAPSFARIFYRNAINQGLPVIVSEHPFNILNTKNAIKIDLIQGSLQTENLLITIPKYPDFISKIIGAGGLVDYARNKK